MSTMSLNKTYEMLATTENLGSMALDLSGASGIVAFSLPSGWNIGLKDKDSQELTDATLGIGSMELALTKEAALGIAHAVGIPPAYVLKTPGVMIQSHLNYWATHSPDLALKLLTKDGDKVLAITKESITPFSNSQILECAVEKITSTCEVAAEDLEVDTKSFHDLHETCLRLVVPSMSQEITFSGENSDMWSAGVQIRNSLTGKVPLSVQGYFYRWSEDSGVIMQSALGKYNRKYKGQDFSEVQLWIEDAVHDVLESVDHEFDVITELTEEPIAGDDVPKVMADIFKTYKVPLKVRQSVMDNYIDAHVPSYYGMVSALSKSANTPGLSESFVTTTMEVAGDVATSAHARCNSCKRVLM